LLSSADFGVEVAHYEQHVRLGDLFNCSRQVLVELLNFFLCGLSHLRAHNYEHQLAFHNPCLASVLRNGEKLVEIAHFNPTTYMYMFGAFSLVVTTLVSGRYLWRTKTIEYTCVWCCMRDSCLDVLLCDRQIDGQTDTRSQHSIYRISIASRGKNGLSDPDHARWGIVCCR